MSFPSIPNISPTISINRSDVVNLLLASVAFEELGLAHLINAEGEKLQAALGSLPGLSLTATSISQLLSVNQSVNRTLQTALKTQMLLQFKLEDVLEIPIPVLIFENIATLTGSSPPGITVFITDNIFFNSETQPVNNGYNISSSTSSGPAPVIGPSVGLLKEISVDGGLTYQEAHLPPGPTLPPGSKPFFRYTVTNDGSISFFNMNLVDNVIGTIDPLFQSLSGTVVQFVATPI